MPVSCPGSVMREAAAQPVTDPNYAVERTLAEFVLFIQDCLEEGRIVTLCDNAYANGGDLELLAMLDQSDLLDKLHGYAGWNTSANTLGTTIAEGVHALLEGVTPAHKDFLAHRYVEDMGYCGKIRGKVVDQRLPEHGLDYFNARDQRGLVSGIVREELEAFVKETMPSIAEHIEITDVWMPWKRMFEVGLHVKWN